MVTSPVRLISVGANCVSLVFYQWCVDPISRRLGHDGSVVVVVGGVVQLPFGKSLTTVSGPLRAT